MTLDVLKGLAITVAILLLQVVVFNNIHLFGCATPLMFVYLVLIAPSNTPRWVMLVAGFLIGIIADMFSNTPGVAAAAMTLVAFVQAPYLKLFLSRETPEDLLPSLKTLGLTKYLGYSFPLVLLFVVVFFTLEEFAFFNWQQWLLYILGSTLVTYLLIITTETLRKG